MPGTQPSVLGNNGVVPRGWAGISNALQSASGLASATATQTGQFILDGYQNTPVVIGPLNQVVTIGAGWISGSPVAGVEVFTNIAGFGIGYISNFANGTITTTEGSTAATLTSTISGTFANGMVIGATTYEVPPVSDNAAPPNYITPGTTFTISGTSITLSMDAALSGVGLYVCAATYTKLNVDAHS